MSADVTHSLCLPFNGHIFITRNSRSGVALKNLFPHVSNFAMPQIGEVCEGEECVIEWTIGDFSALPAKVGGHYFSPSFFFQGANWSLSMYPNGETEKKSEGSVGLYLCRRSSGPPIELNWSVVLKTSTHEIAQERHHTHNFEKKYDGSGCYRLLKRSTLLERQSELAPSGHLTCVCRLKHPESNDARSDIPVTKCAHCKETVIAGSFSSHEKKCVNKPIKCSDIVALKHWYAHECQGAKAKGDSSSPSSVVKSKILEDFKRLFQNQENCDVVLKVKEQEFQVHKNILSVRSPVFASIFRNDMKEKATGVVDIEDCDPSTFSDFLLFLYCEDVEYLSNENVFGLFIAADKYDVSDLSEKCVEFMKENLSIDTFCDTLTLALRHSETELTRLATDFFVANAEKIIVTVEWQTFVAENPTESNELVIKFVASVKQNV